MTVLELRTGRGRALAALVVAVACATVGCTSEPSGRAATTTRAPSSSATRTHPSPSPGPAARLMRLHGGGGPFLASGGSSVRASGYVEQEYVASGLAVAYRPAGASGSDGRWTFRATDRERYRTRVLIRRPARAADASGVVVVEWLNVSSGADSAPAYSNLAEEIIRQHHVWVGISVQKIGVAGGDVALSVNVPGAEAVVGKGLVRIDPARYGSLSHPGDRFALDILTQVVRALRAGGPAVGGAEPKRVLVVGQSQSAFGLVTFIDGVQPVAHVADGFLLLSRGGSSLELPRGSAAADIGTAIFGGPVRVRTDVDVPVMDVQTESDVVGVLGSFAARQSDSEMFRLWEVAGTSHADLHVLGAASAAFRCGAPVNDGPAHLVAKAALRRLVSWVDGGAPPPRAPLLDLDASGILRDEAGLARGGLRTAPVRVPARVLSGAPSRTDDPACLLVGSTRPLPQPRLRRAYADRAAFLSAYEHAADEDVAAGFVLPEDRAALMGYAHGELVDD